jgi:hypothetical protein
MLPRATAHLEHRRALLRLFIVMIIVGVLQACAEDTGRLVGDSLTIDPCVDGRAKVIEPLRIGFPFQAWFSLEESVGMIDLRRDHRAATQTDVLVIQFTDLQAAMAAWQESPEDPLPIDDSFIRVSLAMQRTCPDTTTPLVGTDGLLYLNLFDTHVGGRIEGHAVFDLRDGRDLDRLLPPAGSALALEFGMFVRRGRPYEAFTR